MLLGGSEEDTRPCRACTPFTWLRSCDEIRHGEAAEDPIPTASRSASNAARMRVLTCSFNWSLSERERPVVAMGSHTVIRMSRGTKCQGGRVPSRSSRVVVHEDIGTSEINLFYPSNLQGNPGAPEDPFTPRTPNESVAEGARQTQKKQHRREQPHRGGNQDNGRPGLEKTKDSLHPRPRSRSFSVWRRVFQDPGSPFKRAVDHIQKGVFIPSMIRNRDEGAEDQIEVAFAQRDEIRQSTRNGLQSPGDSRRVYREDSAAWSTAWTGQ